MVESQYLRLQIIRHLHKEMLQAEGYHPSSKDLCPLALYQGSGKALSWLFSFFLHQILPDNHGTCHAVRRCPHPLHTGRILF